MKKAFVIGGGVSGLSCGEALGREGYAVTILEASDRTGGMAATFQRGPFRFDMGPHKLFSPMPEPMAHVKALFPEEGSLLQIAKVSQLHFLHRSFDYPLRMGELLRGLPRSRALRFAASFAAGRLRAADNGSYASFMRRQFGAALYDEVFGPAARKVFGEDEELSALLGQARFRGKTLATFVRHALDRSRRIDAATFHYPRLGTGEVPRRLRERLVAAGGAVRERAPVRAISLAQSERADGSGEFVTALHLDGDTIEVAPTDAVIYTAPLRHAPDLLALGEPARAAAARLRYRVLHLVYLMLRRPSVMRNQWTFFPSTEVSFSRLSEPRNFSPDMAPPGRTSLVCEVTSPEGSPPRDADLVSMAIADLVRLGYIREADVEETHTERLETGYPVWLVGFEEAREALLGRLDRIRNLYPIGRQGLYQYVGILDCIEMALATSRFILSDAAHEGWSYLRRGFEGYPVVD